MNLEYNFNYLLALLFLILLFPAIGYAQSMNGMTNNTMNQHAAHSIDNLVISEFIPLNGQLTKGDYLFLMDLTPFATSIEGHSHIAAKIPCGEDGIPELTIVTGHAPKLDSLNLTKPILNGTVDGKNINLSDEGKSCLYHSDLPRGLNDIALINTSNDTLNFGNGRYSLAITIHGTAIQHQSMPAP